MKAFFKKGQNWFNLCMVVVIAVLFAVHFKSRPKMGFVRSSELVYGFEGMKDAHTRQEAKTKELKANLDTLQLELQRAINNFNKEYASLSSKEREEKQKLLVMQQENFKRYAANAEKTIKESDLELTQGTLNQINTLVEKYARDNNYELVFGTTSSGNILFGETAIDITDNVLAYLNANYTAIAPAQK